MEEEWNLCLWDHICTCGTETLPCDDGFPLAYAVMCIYHMQMCIYHIFSSLDRKSKYQNSYHSFTSMEVYVNNLCPVFLYYISMHFCEVRHFSKFRVTQEERVNSYTQGKTMMRDDTCQYQIYNAKINPIM